MIFNTAKVQQNEVDQETFRSLTSPIDEQNDKIVEMTEGHVQAVNKLQGKLDKCKELLERLELVEKWRLHLKEVLKSAGKTLEDSVEIAVNIAQDVAVLLKEQHQLVIKSDHPAQFVDEEKSKMNMVLEAAKVHKLRASICGRIAKDCLASIDGSDLMTAMEFFWRLKLKGWRQQNLVTTWRSLHL